MTLDSEPTYIRASRKPSEAGTLIAGGKFTEEYLGSLRYPTAYDIYDKMRKSDYQVQRMLRVLFAPIQGAQFKYSPIEELDAEQIKQCTFKNKFYKEWPIFQWYKILYEILSFLPFGHCVCEPWFQTIEDPELGKVVTLADIGYIKQKTIVEWKIAKGVVDSVRQQVSTNGEAVNRWIKGKDLLIFTNQMEGYNYTGVSILRAVYGNYIRKDLYERLDMIGLEKNAIGTPVIYAPRADIADATRKAEIEAVLGAYVGHQLQYVILPDTLKDGGFEIKGGEYSSEAVDNSIKREDLGMIDSILASFLAIGTQRAGGNSQNEGQMGLFLKSITHIAEYVAVALDDLAHKFYVLNFGEPKIRIRMQVSDIINDDTRNTMEIIRGYVSQNIIQADDKLEFHVRDNLGLPAKDVDSVRESQIGQTTDATKEAKGAQPDVAKDNPEPQKKSRQKGT